MTKIQKIIIFFILSCYIFPQKQTWYSTRFEKFWYSNLKHTGQVDEIAFPILLESGAITLDYTIKEKSKGVAKDQGYLFKISSNNLNLLFTRLEEYQLY